MKAYMISLCSVLVLALTAGCYNEIKATQSDTESDTDTDAVGEICDNDLDDDGDGLVDSRDPDCQEPDADTDADVDDDASPTEICNNRMDDDGDGLVDCVDTEDCCSQSVCAGHPLCEEPSDGTSDPDVPEDVVMDPPADDMPADIPAEDVATEDTTTCTPTDGSLVLTWDEGSSWFFDHIRAECWVKGTYGTLEDWHSNWDTIAGTADVADTLDHRISITLAYPACAEVWCNMVAFDVAVNPSTGAEYISLQRYALGSYSSSGTYVSHGTLTATSGTCDVSGSVSTDPYPPGPEDTGPGINFYAEMPICP